MGMFDKAARRAAKMEPVGFLRWLMPGLDPALVFSGWLDARTLPGPKEPDLTCDTLAEFANTIEPDKLWIFVVEFQTEPQVDILDRLLEYMAGRTHQIPPQLSGRG